MIYSLDPEPVYQKSRTLELMIWYVVEEFFFYRVSHFVPISIITPNFIDLLWNYSIIFNLNLITHPFFSSFWYIYIVFSFVSLPICSRTYVFLSIITSLYSFLIQSPDVQLVSIYILPTVKIWRIGETLL